MTSMGIAQFASAGAGYFRDAARIVIHPGNFFGGMPEGKSLREAVRFLCLSAAVYALGAVIFTYENHFLWLLAYAADGLLMPLITAVILYLLVFGVYGKQSDMAGPAKIVCYAHVALMFAWIPGMAPFAEIYKYYLLGVGLVRVGKIRPAAAVILVLCAIVMVAVVIHSARLIAVSMMGAY